MDNLKKLNIAYITYEYPPYTKGGGIGTYMYQISKAMASLGHNISVFCNGDENTEQLIDKVFVISIRCKNPDTFKTEVEKKFANIYIKEKFDVIECAEYGADAIAIKEKYPHIPLIVKLHAPTFLVSRFNSYFFNYKISLKYQKKDFIKIIKQIYWQIRRKKLEQNIFKYDKYQDYEYRITQMADIICSPSKKLANILANEWDIKKKIFIVPNIYKPSPELIQQSIPDGFKTFIFIGKIMILKGIVDYFKAIPLVLNKHPYAKFIFVGQMIDSPNPNLNLNEFVNFELDKFTENITFTGNVSLFKIPELLEKCDALVMPSLWENFPTVCLEAMSAGKLVIGVNSGGIPEIVDSNCGLIAKRKNYKSLASKIIYAIENPEEMKVLAENGRQKILNLYSQEIVGKQMEEIYESCVK